MNYMTLSPFIPSFLYAMELKYVENGGVPMFHALLFHCNVKIINKVSRLDGLVCETLPTKKKVTAF